MAMGEQMPAFWNSSVVCNVHVLDSNNNTILHRGMGTPRSCCYHSHPPRDLHTEHQSYSSFFLRVKHTALSDNQLQFTNLDPSEAYSFIWQSTLISQIQVASFETNQQKLKGKFLSTYRPNWLWSIRGRASKGWPPCSSPWLTLLLPYSLPFAKIADLFDCRTWATHTIYIHGWKSIFTRKLNHAGLVLGGFSQN
jgi:hypothetical protein